MSTASIIAQGDFFDKPAFVPRPFTEVAKREAVMADMEKRETLERRRCKARETSHNPAYGYKRYGIRHATSSDIVNDEMMIPVNIYERTNNINGALFRGDMWVKLFEISSKREGGHGNKINVYCLKENEATARADMAALDSTRRAS